MLLNIDPLPIPVLPISLDDAGMLAALTHPNHLLLVGSWDFARLLPTHIFNGNRYKSYCDSSNRSGLLSLNLHKQHRIYGLKL